jgi:hypothetical protein
LVEPRLYVPEVARLLGISYKKALALIKNEIPSWVECRTTGKIFREYRYTYRSILEELQSAQKSKALALLDNDKQRRRNVTKLDPRPINEFLKEVG